MSGIPNIIPNSRRHVMASPSPMIALGDFMKALIGAGSASVKVPLVAAVKEASTGRMDLTVSSPLGYTEHLIRQYQLGNIGYYCGCAEPRNWRWHA
ncbi:MAG TPA: hypothetical protein VNZ48_08695 [Xanthobacteraceae bacterium]|nr:hypothetical protein [Xanthobacteraceae bacterium]